MILVHLKFVLNNVTYIISSIRLFVCKNFPLLLEFHICMERRTIILRIWALHTSATADATGPETTELSKYL